MTQQPLKQALTRQQTLANPVRRWLVPLGIVLLILFAVMLTSQIGQVNVSNASFGVTGGLLLFLATAPLLLVVAVGTPWKIRPDPKLSETTAQIGNAFLQQWLLPFELASLILLATLIGAVVMARKELKADEA